jgi:hypothetical protein
MIMFCLRIACHELHGFPAILNTHIHIIEQRIIYLGQVVFNEIGKLSETTKLDFITSRRGSISGGEEMRTFEVASPRRGHLNAVTGEESKEISGSERRNIFRGSKGTAPIIASPLPEGSDAEEDQEPVMFNEYELPRLQSTVLRLDSNERFTKENRIENAMKFFMKERFFGEKNKPILPINQLIPVRLNF